MDTKGWKLPITRSCVLVLQEAARPMHYREITAALLKRGLIASRSAAVERCVYSGMSKHIRTRTTPPWFAHAGPGTYSLTAAGRHLQVWRSEPVWSENTEPRRDPKLDISWADAARRVLWEAGKPLHTHEILIRIWKNGYRPRVDGASPQRTLGNLLAELSRESRPQIERVGKGMYSAKQRVTN